MGNPHSRSFGVNTRMLLVRGVAAARAGDVAEARRYLEQLLRAEPNADEFNEACLWLSRMSDEEREKRYYLEEILARRPSEPRARRELALLDGRLMAEEIVNPDNLPPVATTSQAAGTRRFTCPRCAARMVFTPAGEALYCEHCGYGEAPQSKDAIEEKDFILSMARAEGHRQPVAMQAFQCESCTASFLLAPNSLSLTCPYCDATYAVVRTQTHSLIPPDGIITFAVDADTAQQAVDGWLQGQNVKKRALVHPLYLPVWTFDVGGAIQWRGYARPGWSDREGGQRAPITPDEQEGQFAIFVDDHLVAACHTLPPELHPLLESYNLEGLVPFSPDYLADWPAQTYEINVGNASLTARRAAFQQYKEKARRAVGSSLEQLHFSPAQIDILSFKLILVPLWLAHFRHEGKKQAVAVNGQTGVLRGEKGASGVGGWVARLFG